MRWTPEIADEGLINEARCKLARNALPQLVVIVSDDHDFIPLIEELRGRQHQLGVIGRRHSTRLAQKAHRFFPLEHVLAPPTPLYTS